MPQVFLYFFFVFCASKVYGQERIMSLTPCSLDRDCQENSFCVGNDGTTQGLCRCKDGFVVFRNRTFYECLPAAATIGSSCTRDQQCSLVLGNPTSCQGGTCQCNSNAHFVQSQNQCYLTSRPGEICNINFNCLIADGTLGSCFIGRCKCPQLNHHPTHDGRCVRSANLGDVCTEDDACTHTFAACYDVCRCIGGYAGSENGRDCLVAANNFGDNCTELAQCSEYLIGSICQDGACTCHPGFHGIGTRCWREVVARGMCRDRRECFIPPNTMENVDCIDEICTCLEGYVSERGSCVRSLGNKVLRLSYRAFLVLCLLMTILR